MYIDRLECTLNAGVHAARPLNSCHINQLNNDCSLQNNGKSSFYLFSKEKCNFVPQTTTSFTLTQMWCISLVENIVFFTTNVSQLPTLINCNSAVFWCHPFHRAESLFVNPSLILLLTYDRLVSLKIQGTVHSMVYCVFKAALEVTKLVNILRSLNGEFTTFSHVCLLILLFFEFKFLLSSY